MRMTVDLNVTKDRFLSVMALSVNGNIFHFDHRNLPQCVPKSFYRFTFEVLSHAFRLSPARLRGSPRRRRLNRQL
jgi:hypothetical protein